MKKEPLKNKGEIGDCVCGDKEDRDSTKYYTEEEIKSAVEWLRKRRYVVNNVGVVDWDNVEKTFPDLKGEK